MTNFSLLQDTRTAGPAARPPRSLESARPVATKEFSSGVLCSCGHDFGHVRVQSASPPAIQYKLTINQPGDRYEEEADRVATRVTGMAQPGMAKGLNGRDCESAPPEGAARDQREDEDMVMAQPAAGGLTAGGSAAVAPSLAGSLAGTRGGGSPLPDATRSFMEPRFGHDFGSVRVHTDDRAASMARALNAEAFTLGGDIYFGPGRYTPATSSGQWLLAHELTHVVQQNGGSAHGPAASDDEHIQRFSLRGFPPAEETAMKAAIPVAVSKVAACNKLSRFTRGAIIMALMTKRFDYVPDLGLCGWTFPSAWYIEVGKSAFSTSVCCDLASTLAHEASHNGAWKTESGAREMECDCFGCSC
jgi:hypothetical protein